MKGILHGVIGKPVTQLSPAQELARWHLLDPEGCEAHLALRSQRETADEAGLHQEVYAWLERRCGQYFPEKARPRSKRTILRYAQVCREFLQWCAENGFSVPDTRRGRGACAAVVGRFLHEGICAGVKYPALKGIVDALSYMHTWGGLCDPTQNELIRAILRASKRGQPPAEPTDH
jgi:hypothetical protein